MNFLPNKGTVPGVLETIRFCEQIYSDSPYDRERMQRMYQFPSVYKQGLMHKQANQFGYNSKTMQGGGVPLCPCCELPINTLRIKLDYETTPSLEKCKAGEDVFLLNTGSSMFFTFVKMAILYLLLRFLLVDLFNLVTSLQASYCSSHAGTCVSLMVNLSAYNKHTPEDEKWTDVEDVLTLVGVLGSAVFFALLRKYGHRVYYLVDAANHTQDDYTLLVEDIPILMPAGQKGKLDFQYERKIKLAFQQKLDEWVESVRLSHGANSDFERDFYNVARSKLDFVSLPKVRSISLCFDLTQMQKISAMREKLMEKHIQNVAKGQIVDEESMEYIPNQIKYLNQEYVELSKRFAMDESAAFNLSHFVGKAFVSFEFQHYREFMLRDRKVELEGVELRVSQAAKPSDIFWFNMKIDHSERIHSIVYSYLILSLVLLFSFGLLLGIQFYQQEQASSLVGEEVLGYVFTIVVSLLINAINFILASVTEMLTNSQRHKTKTDHISSLMLKNILAQFLNTAIIYYIIALLTPQTSPTGENGLPVKVTSLVAVSGLIQVLINALQPVTLLSSILSKFSYKEGSPILLFQIQLNQKLQDPEFDYSGRYAYYITQTYVVAFYAYLAPATVLVLLVVFALQYWVDKYNLFARSSCPTDYNFRLSRLTLKLFELSVLAMSVGSFLLAPQIHYREGESYRIINLVTLLAGIFYGVVIVLFPKNWEEKLFAYEAIEPQSYTDCMRAQDFRKVYWLTNPATSFAKEKDINGGGFVKYAPCEKFAGVADFDRFREQEITIDKYDRAFEEKVMGLEQALVGQFQSFSLKK